MQRLSPSVGPTVRRLALPAAAVAYAMAASGLASHSWLATVAVLGPAAVIGVRAERLRGQRLPIDDETRRTVTAWSLLLLIGLAWEGWSFLHQPAWNIAAYGHPTLSILLEPLLSHRLVRAAGWLLWLYAGWRLTDRADVTPDPAPPPAAMTARQGSV